MRLKVLMASSAIIMCASCARTGWSQKELDIICNSDSVMTVMIMPADSAVLRARSCDLTPSELASGELRTLIGKMMCTVTDPSQDGVGIAAPQVGINRRLICVQRFDKEGEPFEAYANVKIDSLYGEISRGREGCLSIPGYYGIVPRHTVIDISYSSVPEGEPRHERISDFTAVIFQHECDHLDGILYTDRADSVYLAR